MSVFFARGVVVFDMMEVEGEVWKDLVMLVRRKSTYLLDRYYTTSDCRIRLSE